MRFGAWLLLLLPSLAGAQAPLDFVALTGGDHLGCGLTADGAAWCWGDNEAGQLGASAPTECGQVQCAFSPRRVVSETPFTRMDAGHEHVCALVASGAAYCWGNNATGALGTEAELERCPRIAPPPPPDTPRGCSTRPVPVDGGLAFVAITAGSTKSCGLTAAGDVYCWGMSGSGTDRAIVETPVKLAGGPFRSVSADSHRVCALDAIGRLHCWRRWDSEPGELVPAPEPFTSLSLGWGHACALTAAGTAYCWGDNTYGQVGTGRAPTAHERVVEPRPVAGLRRYREIFAGFTKTCAIAHAGALYCWGASAGGPGSPDCFSVDSLIDCTPSPVRVTEQTFRSVGLGVIHSCAVTTEGAGYCWGRGYRGAFGDGRTGVIADTPLRVDWRG